jgi:signal transduction histidine kinase
MMDERKPASSETVPAAPQTEPPEPAATSTRLDESLRDLQRARTEFAASISRDVRTPLTLLLGPLQDILDSAASALAPGSRSMLETARRNAFRLLTLLDALPDSSRIESGGTLGARAPADLASVTAALVGTFQSVCDAAGLRLIVDCPPLAEALSVDPDAWEKIVVNLVANAFKTTTTGAIEVRLRAQDGNAQLIVSDTGAGMSENELRYVFERIDRVATQDADGSGRATFGLPFVRSLVRRHNGSIDVQSAPGRGTRCIVLLPLESRLAGGAAPATEKSPAIAEAPLPARADARSGSQATAADAAVRRRGHVVVAEDHAETRDYLCHVLEAAGFIVDAVADGLAALAICGARAPDVVVSDVLMPGLSGF